MVDRIVVQQPELLAHAAHVEAIADRVAAAAGVGRAVRAGAEAYGKLCLLVPTMLDAVQDILVDSLNETAGSLGDTGARLRVSAIGYDTTDAQSAASFRSTGSPG
jgi:excreted virulence factor EspC (type VII ESX diderm)